MDTIRDKEQQKGEKEPSGKWGKRVDRIGGERQIRGNFSARLTKGINLPFQFELTTLREDKRQLNIPTVIKSEAPSQVEKPPELELLENGSEGVGVCGKAQRQTIVNRTPANGDRW